jgi:glyoxylase-like metal-dependent hydrolase (beta-lactamase superfamily II)
MPEGRGGSLKPEALKVLTLPARNPGPYTGRTGNSTYLLPGREPALIDAGVGEQAHLDAIADALGGQPLVKVIVTHVHSDHASGAEKIAQRWPEVRFLKMPWPEKDARYPITWEPLADGDLITAGDVELSVLHTPGHAPDHICLWHAATHTLFGGDLAAKGTTVVIPGTRGGSLSAYLRSLRRVLALEPAALLPAHGPMIYDVEALLENYLAHRREREEQIVDALRNGAKSAAAIADALYPGVHPELREAAHDTVVAHLIKLEEEGCARRAGEVWELISAA